MLIIKESLKRLWNTEEIRTLVLVSLCLQFGLVFLSPLRKRTGQKLLILVLWFFYLFADYVAILELGNLLRRQSEATCCHHGGIGLMAVWAPFLLLHLGGPDTITSYSIEDNELWWRHFLGLAIQVVVAFMVLLELVAIPMLRVAAFFVFIAGLFKYSERTWALRSSRMGQLQKSYDVQNQDSNTVAQGNIYETQITEAYEFYKIFKPFVVDHRLSEDHYKDRTTYFRSCDLWKAFKMVEIELSFLYDVLHTKAVLFNGLRGCIWRFISLGMIASSFVLFLKSEKRGYEKADIIISYILFGSALFMDLISLLLIITSDWMIIALKEKELDRASPGGLIKNLAVNIAKVMSCFFPKGKPRWSNSMGQYSLLSFSLRDKETIFRWILDAVKVKELWDNFIYIHSVRVPCKLKELLFEELKTKTTGGGTPLTELKELRDFKLEEVLEHVASNSELYLGQMGFDEIIIMWHIGTDLCFHTHGAMNDNNSHSGRELSLIMSNYMMYLLIMQSSMMPNGIEAKRKCQNIYNETKNIFRAVGKGLTEDLARRELIQGVYSSRWSAETRTRSQLALLWDACRLANELNKLTEDKRWRILSRVWVEILCHAAINGKTYYHSKQLSQGGELLTHVMLLMVHMGIPQKTPSQWDMNMERLPLYN